jgi:hypothetical protein
LILAVLLASGSTDLGAQSTSTPDFSNVNDVLNGERFLLRNDDLLIADQFCPVVDFKSGFDNTDTSAYCGTANARIIDGVTSDSTIVGDSTIDNDTYNYALFALPVESTPLSIKAGRMFNLPYDVMAYFDYDHLFITDPANSSVSRYTNSDSEVVGPYFLEAAMADFNQDGYADIVVVASDDEERARLQIITAVDPDDPSQGVKFGPLWQSSGSPQFNFYSLRRKEQQTALAVGDFNGDGQPEIAAVSNGFSRSGQ